MLVERPPSHAQSARNLTGQRSDSAIPRIDGVDHILLHINNILGCGGRPPNTPPVDELAETFGPLWVFDGRKAAWKLLGSISGGDRRLPPVRAADAARQGLCAVSKIADFFRKLVDLP